MARFAFEVPATVPAEDVGDLLHGTPVWAHQDDDRFPSAPEAGRDVYAEETPSDVLHGVHGCQLGDGRPMLVSRCGIIMEDSGHIGAEEGLPPELCAACDAVTVCPNCGMTMVAMAMAVSIAGR